MEDGTTHLDEELVNQLYIAKEYIETEKLLWEWRLSFPSSYTESGY